MVFSELYNIMVRWIKLLSWVLGGWAIALIARPEYTPGRQQAAGETLSELPQA